MAGIRDVQIGGLAGVPADADAVVLNVTVGEPDGGVVPAAVADRVDPAGVRLEPQLRRKDQIVPNQVTVKLGTGGKVRVFNAVGNVNVIADVSGYYKTGSGKAFFPIVPGRVLDSRSGATNVGAFSTPWSPGVRRHP